MNRDFSSIFHTLLPNAKAKLEPPQVAQYKKSKILTQLLVQQYKY